VAAILVAARARENYNSNNDPNPVVVQKIAKTVVVHIDVILSYKLI
jgi:hypothetical protein